MKRPAAAGAIVVAGFAVLVAMLAWQARGWPLVHDAPLMHYVAWRLSEGVRPYLDVFDMNQPGAYLLHLAVLRTLGAGDMAWRVFDLLWLGASAGLIAAFAAPWGATAAAGGALVFAAYHLAGGAWQAGQRDFLLCAFLLAGALGVTRWLENRARVMGLAAAGIALGTGMIVKPHAALLAAALATLVAVAARRAGGMVSAAVPTLVFGGAVTTVPLVTAGWLAWTGAIGAWGEIMLGYLLPLYSRLGRTAPWIHVHRWQTWLALGAAVALSLAAALVARQATARHGVAALGVAYGLAHYIGQGKGWEYHLYPLAAFAAVLVFAAPGFVVTPRLGVARTMALAVLLALLGAKGLEAAPAGWERDKAQRVRRLAEEVRPYLRPGDTVQVLDTTEGGIHALLRLGVRQPSRFLYDFHFFHDVDTPIIRALRTELLQDLDRQPPRLVLLFERGWPSGGYERIAGFPGLAERLALRYAIVAERPGYRIYAQRDGS